MQDEFQASGVNNLKYMLSKHAQKYYLTQEEIQKLVPRLLPEDYDRSDAALCMVGERHSKGDLVDLVSALLSKIENAESDIRELRSLLAWRVCGSSGYFDDGEMQDHLTPFIDYKRIPVLKLRSALTRRGLAILETTIKDKSE